MLGINIFRGPSSGKNMTLQSTYAYAVGRRMF